MRSFTVAALSSLVAVGLAQPFNLGAATSFALLAEDTITVNGEGILITGDVGSFTTVTGDAQGDITGTIFEGGQDVDNALGDAIAVWNEAFALPGVTQSVPKGSKGNILSGNIFTPGVYIFPAQIFIEGNVTLSGAGNYVFTAGSKLTTSTGTNVILTDGALPEDVLWVTDNLVTFAADSSFQGNLISGAQIVMNEAVVVQGTLIAMSFIDAAGTITDINPAG